MSQFVQGENGQWITVVKKLDEPDSHGRIWNSEAMKQALVKFNERIAAGVVHGELGQPSMEVGQPLESFQQRVGTIKLDNICCQMTSAKINEDNELVATAIPSGRWKGSLEQMLLDQVPTTLGIRAFTNHQANGEITDIKLVTFDVIDPR